MFLKQYKFSAFWKLDTSLPNINLLKINRFYIYITHIINNFCLLNFALFA